MHSFPKLLFMPSSYHPISCHHHSLLPIPLTTPEQLSIPLQRLNLTLLLATLMIPIHSHIRHLRLRLLNLQNRLLKTPSHNIPHNLHIPRLTKTMHTLNGLRFSSRIELGFHHEDFGGGGEIETDASGADGDEDDFDGGIVAEDFEGFGAGFAVHSSVETGVGYVVFFEGVLD
jgi:hypothetical protein